MSDGDGAPTRDEVEALRRRIAELEAAQLPPPAPALPLVPLAEAAAAARERERLDAPAPAMSVEPSAVALPESAPFETMLGASLAPRLGALFVFLASLFFLGVGVQRGLIGPLVQLGVATLAATALLCVAHVLARRGRHDAYPHILEATAATVLYVAAFVAHAAPYYSAATGLTTVSGGILMALVGVGTVALALWRDARVIAGLGYLLGFLTAALGWGVLPSLTLAYVGLLGGSLAMLVARRRWMPEAVFGSLMSGLLFLSFAMGSGAGATPPWLVLAAAAPTAAMMLALALDPQLGRYEGMSQALALVTLPWAVATSVLPWAATPRVVGLVLAGWAAASAGLAVFAVARRAERGVVRVFGIGAVLLWLAMAPFFWWGAATIVPVTLTYATGALALAACVRFVPARAGPALWSAGFVLAGTSAVCAIIGDGRFQLAKVPALSPDQTWSLFLVLGGAFAALVALAPPARTNGGVRAAFAAGVAFVGLWAFVLHTSAVIVTLHLVLLGAVLATVARTTLPLASAADGAAIVVIAAAAVKAATFDALDPATRPDLLPAIVEVTAVMGALLALHHTRVRDARSYSLPLVLASAAVATSWLFAFATGALVSVALGALGVAYLATGLVMRGEISYRYAGFAVLGVVLVRVFLVDLRETDLIVRAGVFAALGVILLGIGYAYSQARQASPEPAEP